MIDSNQFVEKYTENFNYKLVDGGITNTITYIKKCTPGFAVLEYKRNSKYVSFHLNDKTKIFKKSDLLICAIENIPAAWEAENE